MEGSAPDLSLQRVGRLREFRTNRGVLRLEEPIEGLGPLRIVGERFHQPMGQLAERPGDDLEIRREMAHLEELEDVHENLFGDRRRRSGRGHSDYAGLHPTASASVHRRSDVPMSLQETGLRRLDQVAQDGLGDASAVVHDDCAC